MDKLRGTGEWTLALALTTALAACTGSTEPSHTTPTVNPPPSEWVTRAPMPTPRIYAGSAVANGLLYVVGGVNEDGGYSLVAGNPADTAMESYDPATDRWTRLAASFPREFEGVASVNGIIYAIGGEGLDSTNDRNEVYLDRVDAYDPSTNSWTRKAPLPVARLLVATGAVNGVIYAIGGLSQDLRETRVDAYDPSTNTWSSKAPMTVWRSGMGVGVVDGKLYTIGGVDRTGVFDRVEAYDPATDSWTVKAPMPTARQGVGVAVVNGIIYVVGGMGANYAHLTIVEAYNPATDSWTTGLPPMSLAREFVNVESIGGHLYAVGGGIQSQSDGNLYTYRLLEEYTP